MNKDGEINLPVLILSVFGLFTLGLGVSFVYFSINGQDYSNLYSERILSGEIKNPLSEFSIIERDGVEIKINEGLNLTNVEEEMLSYALVELKLYNLHDIPFTSQNPKIEVEIGSNIYSVQVIDGEIEIDSGEINKEDIIIKTTQDEIVKMVNNESYARESFSSGESNVELAANKFILFSKGYTSLYEEFS